MSTIGERMKARREELGLTQAETAKQSNITLSYYNYLERDLRTGSLSVYKRIATTLKTSLSKLVADDDSNPTASAGAEKPTQDSD